MFFSMERQYSSLYLFLLLLLLLLFFNIPHSLSFNARCHEEEKNALLQFKATFFNPSCSTYSSADLKTWEREGKNGDCCNWDGIECDNHTGHVIVLSLSDSCLSGSINSTTTTTIFRLTHLRTLDLSINDFRYSKIPSAISNLSRLEFLDLIDSNISGQIPSEILNLTNLSDLWLSFNDQLTLKNPSLRDLVQSLVKLEVLSLWGVEMSSSIPDSLSKLASLRDLSLGRCKLKGQMPSSLSNLTELEDLSLWENQLTGEIFPSLSNLTNLQTLDLSSNQLTGEIFPQLLRLTKLQDVYLSYNNLSGQIPRTISHLKNLTSLYLGSNNFSGETSLDLFFQLDRLEELDLSSYNFSWVIDSGAKPMSKLRYLYLASCNLRSFPLSLQSQYSLEYLDLSSNDISGEVPQWFMDVNMENLTSLDLSYNHLSGFEGDIPLLKWSLQTLDLRFNQLKGSLPIPSTNSSLRYYLVSNNQFSGELPTRVCDLVNLEIFDIGNNNLSGMIPQCMGELSVLNLHNNSFNGPIPQVGKNRCNLMMIDMSYNRLEGPIPRDMKNCPYLEFLNLGNNKINDVFPSWLGKTNLSVLILRSNRFHGIIEKPSHGYEFPKLQIINLSNNSISGCLPARYFEGWRAMKADAHEKDRTVSYASYKTGYYSYTLIMTYKGIQIEYTKIPESLAVIDLSSNHFKGEIPMSISTLKVLRSLNLSNNMLAGSIPFSLNGLIYLESLDLSHNKLYGKIPQQLTDLTTLECFDVSFNQLIGPIPQSNQFSTFDNSSYQGNLGLCGLPLSRKCGIDSSPPPTLEEDHASRNWIEIDWKIVSMGYTSGFVIGVVMGMNWTRGHKKMGRIRRIKFILS